MNIPRTTFLLPLLLGCSAPTPQPDVYLVCDGTGRTAHGCTHEFLHAEFERRSRLAVPSGGSLFQVVPTADSYATTIPALPILFGQAGDRFERAEAAQRTRAALDAIPIPQDPPAKGRKGKEANQSDLLAALLKATDLARERGRPAELKVASDGRFISFKVDVETGRVPTVEALLKRLASQGVTPDFSIWSQVAFCGVHGEGIDPAKYQAIRALLVDLTLAGHGPPPTVTSTCLSVVPAASWTASGAVHVEDTRSPSGGTP